MPLLEILPDNVENSLRDLRQQYEVEHPAALVNGSLLPALPVEGLDSGTANGTTNGHASDTGAADEATDKDGDAKTVGAAADDVKADDEPQKRIAFATDLQNDGSFGPEWLVVENSQVYVFSQNGGDRAHLRHSVSIESIQEVKTENLVGNGVINARTDVETIPLVRFTQATIGEASLVARQLNALAKGEPPRQEALKEDKKLCPNCKRVLPEDSEVCPGCVNKRAVMLRLFRFLAPYKKQAVWSVLILLGTTLMELAPPAIGGKIVDAITPYANARSRVGAPPASVAFHTLLILVGALAATRVVNALLSYGQRRLNPWLGGRILMDIRVSLYNKFNMLSLAYYDKRNTGAVMNRVTGDADNLWDYLTDGVPWLISNALTLFGIGFILFRMNWQLALLMLLPAPFIYALTSWFMPRARRRWHHVWHRISKMYAALGSTLNGMRVVKAFAQEGREINRFRDRNQAVFEASYAANSFWATYWPLLGLLMSAGAYIIWIFGGWKVINGAMTLGTLTAFNAYLMQFYSPFQNFSRVVDWSTRSLTAAERVFEVLDTEPDIQESSEPVPMPDIKGKIEFDGVGFSYDKAKRILDDFTLTVEPGEMIGLVGHSGAGKSTIINLLSRFYDVAEGSIKIDDVDIRQIKQDDFRRQFGIVLQEPFLFPGTIRDNIAYAKPEATVEEIFKAAKAANCHEFILKFPDGYDTQVGERGQRLSGGERQRISIARAILHNPKILILDEATASVDTETEKLIQEAISRLIENRTTFAIAHRLSTLRNASRLVVMKDGKMVECGTHNELMEQEGVYANLVNIQNEVNQLRAL